VDYNPVNQLPDNKSAVINLLTNWSSNHKIAAGFARGKKKTLIQATFPKGTRYFYTSESMGEFEYIIPGGMFRRQGKPKKITKPQQFGEENEKEKVLLVDLQFIPQNQFFPWPSQSTSRDTRAEFNVELFLKVLKPFVKQLLEEGNTPKQVERQLKALQKKLLYTGSFKKLSDYIDDE
jgi:hypothetical protein